MDEYEDVRSINVPEDGKNLRRLLRGLRWTQLIESQKNPLKPMFAEPVHSFYLSVPLALLFLASTLYPYIDDLRIDVVDDNIIIAVIIILAPFSLFHELQVMRMKRIEASIPDFLRRLAVINEIGMPLTRAIEIISNLNIGVLSSEIRLINKDIKWRGSVSDALMKFERRMRTAGISRAITLITRANEATGNIKEVLKIAANDAALAEKLRSDKFSSMISYTMVIYIAFGVFILILVVLSKAFLPLLPSADSLTDVDMTMIGFIDVNEYTRLFMHASVIQGFFSGLIAGQMGEGNAYSGIKHALVMALAAYLIFTVVM
ncbi:MAG TPA: type II secretion system F family protein [Candidatus Methanoperedenaceae archaeon]|nr:type II secretion system F family protein [Candidatus Methanoperedenaceae archaeon]